MEHATALVDDDATTPTFRICASCAAGGSCACRRYREAGWNVACYACGCGLERPLADELVAALDREPEWVTEHEDRVRHQRDRIAMGASLVLDPGDFDDDEPEPWSSIEDYDVARDEQLVDEYERRVA